MTVESLAPAAEPDIAQARRLPPRAAFYLLASIPSSFLAGSSAPTPLYATYQAMWGFTPMTTTMIFGIYALAVLAALLVLGRLSDHVGRRPVLLAAIAVQLLAMIYFAHAGGVADLYLARVVQGISAGAALGAVGAGLLDLDKEHGTLANAVAAPIGSGLGAIAAGLMAQYLPEPTHLVYYAIAALLVAQGAGVLGMRETRPPRAGTWGSLKPSLSLSPAVRGPMMAAVPTLVAVWALAGFYGSLGPAVIREMLGTSTAMLGGLALFVMATTASLSILLLRNRSPHELTIFGGVALLLGVGVAIAALSLPSLGAFLVGTVISGAGFGAAFQGSIRSVAMKSEPHERAGTLSVAFTVAYLSMGLPAVVAGYLVTRYGDILLTAREFGIAIMALSALSVALAGKRARAGK